jgi:mannosyl-3-phosphoglycerate phosphatase
MLAIKPKQNKIIFTDLDGTLLDHHSYDFSPANEMLHYLKLNDIPIILTTSKTMPEVIALQKQLGIHYPFIIENGAGIVIPTKNEYKMIHLGKTHNTILKAFKRYQKKYSMEGFSSMSIEKVADLTNLPYDNAKMAKERSYGEPFLLEPKSDYINLRQTARNEGFDIVQGGRFYHLITKNIDKANAIKELTKIYENEFDEIYTTIALGDGNNDVTMLENVDIAILIPKYDGSYISNSIKNIKKAKTPGPKGWNESLKEVFNVS